MNRNYQSAIDLLRRRSKQWLARQNPKPPTKNHPNNLNMKEWLLELGHQDIDSLDVIHITGTKGKGSTAALADCLIRTHFQHQSRPFSVGLYTSPHLITERERIRINSEPISEQLFTQYFFEVWDALYKNIGDDTQMPGYLQLLFLLSVHVFKKEAVDMAIYEVHAGGRKDATNIFKQPVACGFTTIGLDHADLLGNTIQSIAGHKSGIMKRGTPAYSVVQPEAVAREVLEDEAMKLGCPLQFVEVGERLPDHPKLRLAVQKQNASLAIELVNAFLRRRDDELDEGDVLDGTLQCDWPGRFQRIRKGTTDWYLDIAHNCLSLPIALEWFRSEVTSSIGCSHASKRILIFGHESARDTQDLISTIARVCEQLELYFDLILLSPYKRYGVPVYESTVDEDAAYWRGIQPQTQIECSSSFKAAVAKVEKRRFQGSQILITGSTYLVGEALATLRD